MLYTPFAVMTGLVYGFLPFMILPIYASLEKLDLSLLEAAEVLGARPAARFLRVTLPLSMPGVVAGSLLVFIPALGSFLTSDLLGGAKQIMIGNLVQNQFTTARNWPFGSAASFIVMALVLVAVLVYLRVRDQDRGAAIADVRRTPRWLIGVTSRVYLFLHLPMLVLVVFSFNESKFSVEWTGFTLHWYHRLLERPDILRGLKASLIVGVASTVDLDGARARCIALALARHRFRGRHAVRGVPLRPDRDARDRRRHLAADPVRRWSEFRSGLTTIIIAHVAFNISFVVVVVLARLEGMDRNLEEAAMILGADELTAFWKVTVPQLWPGILSGALLAFTMSFDDYVITSFVSGTGSSTLPIVVYGMVRRNIEPSINAISTIILLVTTALIYFADRLSRED